MTPDDFFKGANFPPKIFIDDHPASLTLLGVFLTKKHSFFNDISASWGPLKCKRAQIVIWRRSAKSTQHAFTLLIKTFIARNNDHTIPNRESTRYYKEYTTALKSTKKYPRNNPLKTYFMSILHWYITKMIRKKSGLAVGTCLFGKIWWKAKKNMEG